MEYIMAKIKLPKFVMISGTKYKIITKNMGNNDAGETNRITKVILINNTLPMKEQLNTLYHEIWHGICTESGTWQAVMYGYEQICAENFAKFNMSYFHKDI